MGREARRRKERRKALRENGWSPEGYDKQYQFQRGCCAICGAEWPVLCADHDHRTGKARSLLCRKCNAGLGLFQDDVDITQAAARYLSSWRDILL